MSAKHTPGPWQFCARTYSIADTGDYDRDFTIAAAGKDFAQLFGSDDEDEANARLIAASPDQHEACKTSLAVLCAIRNASTWHPNTLKDIDFAIEANRAAIAKATGS